MFSPLCPCFIMPHPGCTRSKVFQLPEGRFNRPLSFGSFKLESLAHKGAVATIRVDQSEEWNTPPSQDPTPRTNARILPNAEPGALPIPAFAT
jgi:hypothetical protein